MSVTSAWPTAYILGPSIHKSEAIEVVVDEGIRVAQGTYPCTRKSCPRSLREERLKDVHLKPIHASVKPARKAHLVNLHCHRNDRECLKHGMPEQSAEK